MKKLIIGAALLLMAAVGVSADWNVYEIGGDGDIHYVGHIPSYAIGGYVIFDGHGNFFEDLRDFTSTASGPTCWGCGGPGSGSPGGGGCFIGYLSVPCLMLFGPSTPSDPVYWLNRINQEPVWLVQAERFPFLSSWYEGDPDGCVSYVLAHQNDSSAMIATAATLASIIYHQGGGNPPPKPHGGPPRSNYTEFTSHLTHGARDLANSWFSRDGGDMLTAWLVSVNFMQYSPFPEPRTSFGNPLPQTPIP